MSSSLYGGQGATGNMQPSATGQKPWKEKIPSGYKTFRQQQFTPQQMQQHEQMFQYTAPDSYLSRLAGGDQSMFGEIEAPAFRQFNQQMGNMASRFSGMGGTGSRRSSGFQNAGSQAASNFAQDLQANRQNLQRQALMDLRGLSQELLSAKPYETGLVKKPQEPSWAETIGKWGGFIPGAVTSLFKGGGSVGDAASGASQIPGAATSAYSGGNGGGGYSVTGGTNRNSNVFWH